MSMEILHIQSYSGFINMPSRGVPLSTPMTNSLYLFLSNPNPDLVTNSINKSSISLRVFAKSNKYSKFIVNFSGFVF